MNWSKLRGKESPITEQTKPQGETGGVDLSGGCDCGLHGPRGPCEQRKFNRKLCKSWLGLGLGGQKAQAPGLGRWSQEVSTISRCTILDSESWVVTSRSVPWGTPSGSCNSLCSSSASQDVIFFG